VAVTKADGSRGEWGLNEQNGQQAADQQQWTQEEQRQWEEDQQQQQQQASTADGNNSMWEYVESQSQPGSFYYKHKLTGQTQWEAPTT
jgi:hypothetical protein